MKRLAVPLILCALLLSHLICKGQATLADTLKAELSKAGHDTTRCQLLSVLIELDGSEDIWPVYNEQMKQISKKNIETGPKELSAFFRQYYALSLNNSGYLAMQKGDSYEAYKQYYLSLEIYKSLNDKKGIASAFVNIGQVFRQEGNISKALEFYHNAMKLQLETGDKLGLATSYNNIAFVFDSQGEIPQALDYYQKSLQIYKEINDKEGIATAYSNLGFIYSVHGDPSCKGDVKGCRRSSFIKAIEYLNTSAALQEEINDLYGLASSLNILGGIYDKHGDPSCDQNIEECLQSGKAQALKLFLKSLELRRQTNNTVGLSHSYYSLAEHMLNTGRTKEALEFAQKGLAVSKELGSPERIRDAAILLKEIYEKEKRYEESLNMYNLYVQMKDSILNEETKRSAIRKGFQIEYEKQAATDSIRNAAKLNEERIKNEAAIEQQRSYTYGGLIGFALMLLVAIISIRAFRNKQKANLIITEQKEFSEKQKLIIEHKQKEIIDSINYAKRLQEAILPPKEFIDKHVPENFIIYQPKDLVAGDFYWAEERNGLFFIAAADSTGHGVPGALVSVVCGNALNRAVKEFALKETGKILDKTRELVLETFERSSSDVKDGMDISLLCIDKNKREVSWSGANNPLWYISNNELKEIKADKQPIGKTDDPRPFTTHKIDYKEGTFFYLFTDGMADQFGGPQGKKFKYKQLSELFIKNAGLDPKTQSIEILRTFNEWKGKLEQVDDQLLIGVKL
jgi:serine phosphatase RsbU (regulator of sigma subunit)